MPRTRIWEIGFDAMPTETQQPILIQVDGVLLNTVYLFKGHSSFRFAASNSIRVQPLRKDSMFYVAPADDRFAGSRNYIRIDPGGEPRSISIELGENGDALSIMSDDSMLSPIEATAPATNTPIETATATPTRTSQPTSVPSPFATRTSIPITPTPRPITPVPTRTTIPTIGATATPTRYSAPTGPAATVAPQPARPATVLPSNQYMTPMSAAMAASAARLLANRTPLNTGVPQQSFAAPTATAVNPGAVGVEPPPTTTNNPTYTNTLTIFPPRQASQAVAGGAENGYNYGGRAWNAPPDNIVKNGLAGWWDQFAREHPYTTKDDRTVYLTPDQFYDNDKEYAVAHALHDKAWGDQFYQTMGRPPSAEDWRVSYRQRQDDYYGSF